jgi:hypothetical protein
MIVALSAIINISSYSWKELPTTHIVENSFLYFKDQFKYNHMFEDDYQYLLMLQKVKVSMIKADSLHVVYRSLDIFML